METYPENERSFLRLQGVVGSNYAGYPESYDRHCNYESERRYLRGQTDRETETDTDRDDQWSRVNEQRVLSQKSIRTFSSHCSGRWGDTSTVVAGDGNEFSREIRFCDEERGFCLARYSGHVVVGLFAVVALISPVLMVVLPRFRIHGWDPDHCGTTCESSLLSLSFRLLFLLIGSWAVFVRKPKSTVPRVFVLRAVVIVLLFLVTFIFWLFYGMRIFRAQVNDYDSIALYAVAFVDVLLFLHYVAVILLEIRHLHPQFVVKIVRSPDGEVHSYNVGQLSVQHLAVWCLQQYYRDFEVYNPYLDHISRPRPSATKFKIYSIDSNVTGGGVLPESSSSVLQPGRNQGSEHNRRFYDEQYNELKVERRKVRLISAVEDAYAQIEQFNGIGNRVVLDANQVAQAVFPIFGKALHKYLNATRQRPRYTKQDVLRHLAFCINFNVKPRAFLNRYLTQGPVIWNDREYDKTQAWTLRSNLPLNRSIHGETIFHLYQSNVSLLVTARKIPHFNLTEYADTSRFSRFIFRASSETKF